MKLQCDWSAGGLPGPRRPSACSSFLSWLVFTCWLLLACLPSGFRPCGQSAGGGLGDLPVRSSMRILTAWPGCMFALERPVFCGGDMGEG